MLRDGSALGGQRGDVGDEQVVGMAREVVAGQQQGAVDVPAQVREILVKRLGGG